MKNTSSRKRRKFPGYLCQFRSMTEDLSHGLRARTSWAIRTRLFSELVMIFWGMRGCRENAGYGFCRRINDPMRGLVCEGRGIVPLGPLFRCGCLLGGWGFGLVGLGGLSAHLRVGVHECGGGGTWVRFSARLVNYVRGWYDIRTAKRWARLELMSSYCSRSCSVW